MRLLALAAALLLSATAAHAQYLTEQRFGNQAIISGTTPSGEPFSGYSQRFGNQTLSTYSLPGGQSQTCVGTSFGSQTITTC